MDECVGLGVSGDPRLHYWLYRLVTTYVDLSKWLQLLTDGSGNCYLPELLGGWLESECVYRAEHSAWYVTGM